jgi:hypothetical protein
VVVERKMGLAVSWVGVERALSPLLLELLVEGWESGVVGLEVEVVVVVVVVVLLSSIIITWQGRSSTVGLFPAAGVGWIIRLAEAEAEADSPSSPPIWTSILPPQCPLL